MKQCAYCKVSVVGHMKKCPLCQNTLAGEDTPDVFPTVDTPVTNRFFLRLIVFLSLVAAIVCVVVNTALPHTGAWSVFVVAGVVCIWISLGVALLKRRSLLKNIIWQAFLLSVLAILWDYFTGWHVWSVNFVIPCILFVTMLLTPGLAYFLRMTIGSYLVYICIVFLLGLVPAGFLLLDIPTIVLPSIICVGYSVILLTALLVFCGRTLLGELERRLHF